MATIYLCESAFTSANGNIICTEDTTNKSQGTGSCFFVDNGGTEGTNTKLAYVATGSLNLSGTNAVRLDMRIPVGRPTLSSGAIALYLCSDTSGNTPLYIANLPTTAVPATGSFTTIIAAVGANMGSTVNSIAIYTFNGYSAGTAVQYNLDNITSVLVSVNTNKSFSYTQASTTKAPGKAVSKSLPKSTQASTVTLSKALPAKVFSTIQASTCSLSKGISKVINVTQGSIAGLSSIITRAVKTILFWVG